MHGRWTVLREGALENGLSHRSCGAGTDQSFARFFKILRAKQLLLEGKVRGVRSLADCVFCSLPVRKVVAVLQAQKSREDEFSSLLQLNSFHGVEGSVSREEENDKAA